MQEIADAFGCVESAVRKALKKLKITRKKTKQFVERDERKREEYMRQIEGMPEEKRGYADEAGFESFVYREYARAP